MLLGAGAKSACMVQFEMNSPHDYLEFSFEDFFGQWDAVLQQFQPAIRHRTPHRSDNAFSRANLLARLLQGNFQGLPEDIIAGLALLWCVACFILLEKASADAVCLPLYMCYL
jgi:hypothetical protein